MTETTSENVSPRSGISILCLALLGGLEYYQSGSFQAALQLYANQLEGLCLDGNQTKGPAGPAVHFEVVSQQLTGLQVYTPATQTPELLCAFPVMVWPCAPGECDVTHVTHELPAYERVRKDPTGVYCWRALGWYTFGVSPCNDEIWDCTALGKCNGYHKSERLCDSKLKLAAYPCIFDPTNPAAGIREERVTFLYPLYYGIPLFVCLAVLAGTCWKVGGTVLTGLTTYYSKLKTFARLLLAVLVASTVLFLIQRAFLVYLVPGETSYSLHGAPQLASPSIVRFKKISETSVPAGLNQPPIWATAIMWIIWIVQLYLGLFVGFMVPTYVFYRLFLKKAPTNAEGYERMESKDSSEAEEST